MSNGGTKVAIRREPVEVQDLTDESVLALITEGDTSRLSIPQKLAYYKARCEIAGLDYRTAPMNFLKLQGKEQLYTLKAGTDQLASKHGIKLEILSQVTEDDIRIVTVRATCKDGRQTDEIGSVSVAGLKGQARSDAYMKCSTKAKRRAILSVTGMGTNSEDEVETIPGAVIKPVSDLPWAERTSAQAAKGTPDVDLASTLTASLEVEEGVSPIASPPILAGGTASLPRSEGIGSSDGEAPSLLMDDLGEPMDEPVFINEKDRRYFHKCREDGNHSKEATKDWLQATYGIQSTSEILVDWLRDICARLRDPMPL